MSHIVMKTVASNLKYFVDLKMFLDISSCIFT